jgi:hypothetical protein
MEHYGPLLKVCTFLNEAGAEYIVIGGYACVLHGYVRTTHDVDLLVPESKENFLKVREALARLEDGAAKELTLDDFKNYLVLTINDEVQVDVSRQAWKVNYAEALPTIEWRTIEGIKIPFLGIDRLLESKSTYRAQDEVDCAELRAIKEKRRG